MNLPSSLLPVSRRQLRRCFLAAALALSSTWPMAATAQAAGPLVVIVPFAPGGTSDALARVLGESVGRQLGQSVVVENKPGGGTVIGTQAALAAPADGQTLLMNAASSVINTHLRPQLNYDIRKDFAPVSLLASNPHILVVHPAIPVTDLKGFIAWSKGKSGAGTYASFGTGSSGHLGFERLKKAAGIDLVHVPYKGVAPATTDLIGGQVDAMLTDLAQVVPHVRSGKLKAIALAGEARSPLLPDVPTFSEAGLAGFTSKSWFGLLVRAGTPAQTITRLNGAFVTALAETAVRERLAQAGMDPIGTSAADFGAFMTAESAEYGEAVKFSGAKLD